jgi:hypothetical protein
MGVLQETATGVYKADTLDPLVFGASVYPVGWRAANPLMYDLRFYNYAVSASQVSTIGVPPVATTVTATVTSGQMDAGLAAGPHRLDFGGANQHCKRWFGY